MPDKATATRLAKVAKRFLPVLVWDFFSFFDSIDSSAFASSIELFWSVFSTSSLDSASNSSLDSVSDSDLSSVSDSSSVSESVSVSTSTSVSFLDRSEASECSEVSVASDSSTELTDESVDSRSSDLNIFWWSSNSVESFGSKLLLSSFIFYLLKRKIRH